LITQDRNWLCCLRNQAQEKPTIIHHSQLDFNQPFPTIFSLKKHSIVPDHNSNNSNIHRAIKSTALAKGKSLLNEWNKFPRPVSLDWLLSSAFHHFSEEIYNIKWNKIEFHPDMNLIMWNLQHQLFC
jgi:hypothetical protein